MAAEETGSIVVTENAPTRLIYLPIDLIFPSRQPLREGSSLQDATLLESIKTSGVLQPLLARRTGEYLEVIAGNRRLAACRELGLIKVPCQIIDTDDKRAFEFSLIENLQRKRLNPVEEAEAYRKYIVENRWGTASDLARRVGRSLSYVTKRIKLLELPDDIVEAIKCNSLNESVAEELFCVENQAEQSRLARLISTRHLSFRDARKLIKRQADHTLEAELNVYERGESHQDKYVVFNIAISALRHSLDGISSAINRTNDWVLRDMLMQHRHTLHSQIDLLIRQRERLRDIYLHKEGFRRRNFALPRKSRSVKDTET